ncbi:FAD-dependent oxidoreductase [Gammaproteobacteria bacterium]|nr:FAD-dependent oxidoreductase [Gammaproteobacteria bacterium]
MLLALRQTLLKPRGASADGPPYIGETSSKGLWLNTGHGHLGWTLAAGSAELLADLITGKPTALDASTFAVTRSTPARI